MTKDPQTWDEESPKCVLESKGECHCPDCATDKLIEAGIKEEELLQEAQRLTQHHD